MNKKLKTMIVLLLILCITFLPITAFAHSGRTDAYGGHHDYHNKSGLGSYHYHCGGHPAHLHPNGVCPYKATATVSTASASNTSQTKTAPTNSNQKTATIVSGTVYINNHAIDNSNLEYPLISYNNVTYFPMTYRNKLSLGLTSETKNSAIYFTTGSSASYTADITGSNILGKKVTSTKLNYSVYINQTAYSYDSNWPLLKYHDIVYIPLTYDFADTLGLTTTWTKESGLFIYTK